MTKELNLWVSEFGDDYVDRNQLTPENIAARANLWQMVMMTICQPNIGPISVPESFLEVGAGLGGNLAAINMMYSQHGRNPPTLYALEPNKKAREHLAFIENLTIKDGLHHVVAGEVDLVFTSGVLIHVHPDDQLKLMKEIYRVSKKWIVCIEYFSPELREMTYHEEKALWTRDYGSLWLDNFKVHCLGYSFNWKRMSGLDNVTCWVFQKVN